MFGKAVWFVLALSALYQYLEFSNIYTVQTREKESAMGLAGEDVCLDTWKKSRYSGRVDCSGAEDSAKERVWAAAFRQWWETRYIYRMATLDDIYMKIGFFVLLIYFLHLVFTHRGRVQQQQYEQLQYMPPPERIGPVWRALEWSKHKVGQQQQQSVVHLEPGE